MNIQKIGTICLLIGILISCSPSDSAVQTAIASTEAAKKPPAVEEPCGDIDLSGYWSGDAIIEDGEFGYALQLQQSGCSITGLSGTEGGGIADVEGSIEDDTLHLEEQGIGDYCYFSMDFSIAGEKLLGTSSNCLEMTFNLERTSTKPEYLEESAYQHDAAVDCDVSCPYKQVWPIIFCDTFDDNRNNWELGAGSSDLEESNTSIEHGKLIMDFSGKAVSSYTSGVIRWTSITDAYNFMLTITGKINSVNRDVTWGIAFRGDQSGFYVFDIGNQGWYYFSSFVDSKHTILIPVRSNSIIRWDEENTLTIIAEGDQFEFYVNGQLLDSFESSQLRGSVIYLTTWLAEGATAVFEFDDLLIRSD